MSIILLRHKHASSEKDEKGQIETLKRIEIKVSPCKKSGIHQPIRLGKDGFTSKKSIEFAESNLLSVLEAEVKLPSLLTNMIFNYSPITPGPGHLCKNWVKSNGELTWLTSSTPVLNLIDFIQKNHVLKDKRLDIS